MCVGGGPGVERKAWHVPPREDIDNNDLVEYLRNQAATDIWVRSVT